MKPQAARAPEARTTKGQDHSRPFRFSAWRRYHVRRDMPSLSQGFLASIVLARSSMRGRPLRARFIGCSVLGVPMKGHAVVIVPGVDDQSAYAAPN